MCHIRCNFIYRYQFDIEGTYIYDRTQVLFVNTRAEPLCPQTKPQLCNTHTHTRPHRRAHTHTHMHIHTHAHTHVHTHTRYVHMHTHTHTQI